MNVDEVSAGSGTKPLQTTIMVMANHCCVLGFQTLARWDWRLEITQATILDAPNTSVSPSTAQGQLGLGGSYYVGNGNNSYPAAAFLKQGLFVMASTETRISSRTL